MNASAFCRRRCVAVDSADMTSPMSGAWLSSAARELGFPLDTIRTLLALAAGGGHSCDQARQMAEVQLGEVRAKLSDLERMAIVLSDLVKACEKGDAGGCPLLEALSTETRLS